MGTKSDLDRLVSKEVSLGVIREIQPPEQHIGLQVIAPFLPVESTEVVFDYIKGGLQEGLAPARAADAESELAQKDDLVYGSGRASLIDWAHKDKYTMSDVARYRDDLRLAQATSGISTQLNFNTPQSNVDKFNKLLARDQLRRRRNLDHRMEWLIMGGFAEGKIEYNDGKVNFVADFGRPADQNRQAPAGGMWGLEESNPIQDIKDLQRVHFDKYGVKLTRGVISTKIAESIWKSKYFLATTGFPILGGTPNVPLDPEWLGLRGYTPEAALELLQRATGITFIIYDGTYRTRPIGGTTYQNNRFVDETLVVLYPGPEQLSEIDDTELGFAKTLTAPHPEGNWGTGFYEWEQEEVDPWMHVRGTGITAFPVFPYAELTYSLKVL